MLRDGFLEALVDVLLELVLDLVELHLAEELVVHDGGGASHSSGSALGLLAGSHTAVDKLTLRVLLRLASHHAYFFVVDFDVLEFVEDAC